MYSDWRSIPIPARLANRPRDVRGYPIPAVVIVDAAGTPDFRVTDVHKWVAACKNKTCALCGEPLGRHMAFIGGPLTFENRYFTDLPSHRECAEYAMQVCPYIAVPNFKHASNIVPGKGVTLHVTEETSTIRPDRFLMGIAKGYAPMRTESGGLIVRATPWEQVSWWRDGRCEEPLRKV